MPKDNSSADRGVTKTFTFWQDREIRFDSTSDVFRMRENAEEVLATFHRVEDSKGNSGRAGTLLVTNLRIIWWCDKHRSINLSVGHYCITNITVQETQSKLLGGNAEALQISTKYGTSRFLFVFTHVSNSSNKAGGNAEAKPTADKLFSTVQAAWRAYDTTRVYREIRVRTAVIQHGNLTLLPEEHILTKLSGVSNISKDEGHMGCLVTTNIRVVWFSVSSESFNVSIPFLQFIAVRQQSSKLGPALVIETSSYAGNFTLGFRVDPPEKLPLIYQEVLSLWKAWTARPVLGIKVNFSEATAAAAEAEAAALLAAATDNEAVNVLEEAPTDGFAAYYADEGQKGADRKPVYEPGIGLAVEKLRKGVTMSSLWDVVVN